MADVRPDVDRGASSRPGRVPPHNLQAEESLLGAMLLSKDAIASAVETVGVDDFYKPAHGHIFDAITSLYGAGEPSDPVTVAEELRRAGLLDAIGGHGALVGLQANTPATTSAGRYGKIIEEHALLRRMIYVAGEIAEKAYSLPDDVTKTIDEAESMVFSVAERRMADSTKVLNEMLGPLLDRLEQLYERKEAVTGLATGYSDLDELLAGLQPSSLVVVGARPSMGKTAFALGMARHAAVKVGKPVLLFSLEMSQLEVTERLIAAEANVDGKRLRTGRLTQNDWTRINHAVGRLSPAPLFVDDNAMLTVMDIRAKARRLKSRVGELGLVIVDYIQLMTGRTDRESRQVEVSEISRNLKILARELETPVVACAQLNRQLETRADKRPMLSDLRESGCVTADTLITRADTGAQVSIGELLLTGERDISVWSLDENLRVVPATMSHAFESGLKEVFEVRLASGRTVKASANHPFLCLDGWTRLDELRVGSRIAVPRHLPAATNPASWPDDEVVLLAHLIGDGCVAPRQPIHYTSADPANIDAVDKAARHFGVTPRLVRQSNWWHLYLPAPYKLARGRRNPIAAWLDGFGLYGRRSYEKFLPPELSALDDRQVALFLRHLWATDGSVHSSEAGVSVYYATTSNRLALDLQELLQRFGVSTRLSRTKKGDYRPGFQLHVVGSVGQTRFLTDIGVHGERGERAERALDRLAGVQRHAYSDALPHELSERVREKQLALGLSEAALARSAGMPDYRLYRSPFTRERLAALGAALDDANLVRLANSDVRWDRVVAIESKGQEQVFDATVLPTHNFLANGIVVENSIEQDADVVVFLYRDQVYNPETADRDMAEVIVAKHRSGPTGNVRLAWLPQSARFHDMGREM